MKNQLSDDQIYINGLDLLKIATWAMTLDIMFLTILLGQTGVVGDGDVVIGVVVMFGGVAVLVLQPILFSSEPSAQSS